MSDTKPQMVIKRTEPNIRASNTDNDPLDDRFEKLIKETSKLWQVPGASVAVVDGERTHAQVFSCLLGFLCSYFYLRAKVLHPSSNGLGKIKSYSISRIRLSILAL